ncbi:MAG: YbaB/EbfC family nucleoid-associated protein [Eubacteriales bacterium]|nr:YbaB/EbfC family nucleoid-associated protein [Eubacteriales bacterium]MDD3073089.1 YbaB/EbfC family nucleoid-associated protein [Eubacteriales bacterium]MDD4079051.1 YbaB/EbfC family nucleoid-associated protein [Eubacteriales bacterium]MDD4768412.1 YbaB/EbfC family nucleoid-associated protein [Eubacteriales bacterium]
MGMGKAMKQIQKMQAEMKKMQAELEFKRISATAGGGMVEAVVDGNRRIVEIKIKPEVVDPDDIETLQDLLQAAVNEATRKAEEYVAEEMQKITGGLQLPPGLL